MTSHEHAVRNAHVSGNEKIQIKFIIDKNWESEMRRAGTGGPDRYTLHTTPKATHS